MRKKKNKTKTYKKQHIPKALREQCWITNFGHTFKHKCYIKWCKNTINVFDYHAGHNIPECQGGKLCLENLKPICSRCNHSMGSQYTITEWMKLDENMKQSKCCFFKYIIIFNNIYIWLLNPRYRDRVPTLQDFMDKDFEIKQINDNISEC